MGSYIFKSEDGRAKSSAAGELRVLVELGTVDIS
jgi:hypothetical protein